MIDLLIPSLCMPHMLTTSEATATAPPGVECRWRFLMQPKERNSRLLSKRLLDLEAIHHLISSKSLTLPGPTESDTFSYLYLSCVCVLLAAMFVVVCVSLYLYAYVFQFQMPVYVCVLWMCREQSSGSDFPMMPMSQAPPQEQAAQMQQPTESDNFS